MIVVTVVTGMTPAQAGFARSSGSSISPASRITVSPRGLRSEAGDAKFARSSLTEQMDRADRRGGVRSEPEADEKQ